MSRSLPIGRAGEPEDVADGIIFLLSSDSDYMTGQTMHVNGGMVLP
jgi:3-oxoacyl-[acyl-carrier protein] reductase